MKVGTRNKRARYRPLTIQEKQDILTQQGESWPACECHGEPKIWNPWAAKGGGYWQCRIKKQDNSRKQRLIRKMSGQCQACALPPSECTCQVNYYNRQIRKYDALLSLDKDDPEYIAIVRKEQTIG